MAQAKRDENYVTTLIAVSNVDGVTPVTLYADPTTHRLLVSASAGSLATLSDVTLTSPAQGDILYNNGSAWVNLPAGTNGFFLKTQGAAANPVWAAATASTATAVTVADEAADTSCFPLFVTAATGDLGPKSNAGLTFNSATGILTATGFAGPLTGNSSTATALQTARTIAGVSFDGSANITIALDNLSDVATTSPAVDQILKFNGSEWINAPFSNTSAGTGVVFFNDDTTITASGTNSAIAIATLSKTPTGGAEVADTAVANSNTVAFNHAYLYNTALGVTTIDAGVWEFDTYAGVSAAAGVSEVLRNVFKVVPEQGGVTITTTGSGTSRTATASGGTPFAVAKIDTGGTLDSDSYLQTPQGLYRITARTSDTVVTIATLSTYVNETGAAFSVWKRLFQITTGEINNISPAYQLYSTNSVQSAFTINATDKIGSMVFARTDAAANRTLTFVHNGTTNYSHFHSPLSTKHNDLAGLNGGTTDQYYHLTLAEYTGTGSNEFVRKTTPTLVTPVLGAATATSINGLTITSTTGTLTLVNGSTLATAGAFSTTLTATNTTNVTLPTTGTLATLAGTEELDNKTLDSSVGKGTWTASGTWTLPAMTLGGDVTMAENVAIVLDAALSADGKYSGIVEDGTAGAALAFGDLCYFQASDSRWELADANLSAGYDKKLGICVLAAGADGNATKMLLYGKVRADANFPTLTIGSPVYMAETAGDIVVAQPTTADVCIRVIGYGNTADELFFCPSNDYLVHV